MKDKPSVTSTCASSAPGSRRSNSRSIRPPRIATPMPAAIAAGQKPKPMAIRLVPK